MATDVPDELAAANAATGIDRGEHQATVFAEHIARVRRDGAFIEPPDLGTPPPGPQPAPDALRGAKVAAGRVLGAVGSGLLHRVTSLLGRHTSGRIWTNWYASGAHLPGPVSTSVKILKLAHMRETLFANNVVRTYAAGQATGFAEPQSQVPAFARRWRTADGSWNDLSRDEAGRIDPMVGAAYTRFFRNVGDDQGLAGVRPRENPASDPVSVRDVSRKLLAPKGPRVEMPFLNLWGGAWIQFQNHDWISHGTDLDGETDTIPLAEDDPLREHGIEHLEVRRSLSDPTRRDDGADRDMPVTFLNEVTHWWDASQIYGSDWESQHSLRAHTGGRLIVNDDGSLPLDPETGTERSGFVRNWWVGLAMLHTLFAREHNAIADTLARSYPDWDDEALFQTARLVNAALIARIHTLEWTPAILPNEALLSGMEANWFGLVTSLLGGERKQALEDVPIASRELGGIVGNAPGDAPTYGLSEEFVSIYRLHSLLPDRIRLVDAAGDELASVPFQRTRHAASPALLAEHGFEALARTLGEQSACALVNNNYPDSLRAITVPGAPVADIGAIDLYRDRERGVPSYNQLRRELGLEPVPSFDALTDDRDCVATLREVYGTDADGHDNIDDMDLLVGTLSEGHRPTGFGFGETLFQIFILNASLRLLGDRFYTTDFREEIYTPEGIAWVDGTTMKDVLLRHYPDLAQTGLANVSNAFEPWDIGPLSPERHPLRAWEGRHDDPWAGDAPDVR
ncbi:peroxidase [Mumia zhuanghuii]|uniref:Peroxidase family protein n=2 Tax=Mumia TaxID=1546255 RepID=A0ABW1QHI9_9ACTN|nr:MULTISPECIES: peroxidase family protein [Mumia]KAA1418167.1 peroxidase [Mumia zhuanghuii]